MEQERDFFTLLLMEGSTGAERENFLGVEGQKEFAPEVMEHIQVCEGALQVLSLFQQWAKALTFLVLRACVRGDLLS